MTSNITDQQFEKEVLQSDTPVMVDFWAEWCQPCRMVSPVVDELSEEYKGKIKFAKMNVDENAEIPGQFGIMSIPTLMVFKNGQPLKTMVGVQGKDTMKKALDEALN
jgi:thioredoxin 1